MAKQTLRELAKEHAQGNLDREAYRKSRAELIQGILSSEIPLEEIDYPPLVQPPEPEELDDTQRKEDYKREPAKSSDPEATTAPKASVSQDAQTGSNSAQPGSSNKVLIGIVGFAVLAIVAVAAIALLNGKGDKTGVASPASPDPSASASRDDVSEIMVTDQLIREFLAAKNWSSAQIEGFRQQWNKLDAETIERSRDSLAMGQLTNAIYKQLLEEQALSGLMDDDSSLKKQQQLVEFAQSLGIEDSRIRLPESIESAAEDMLQ